MAVSSKKKPKSELDTDNPYQVACLMRQYSLGALLPYEQLGHSIVELGQSKTTFS